MGQKNSPGATQICYLPKMFIYPNLLFTLIVSLPLLSIYTYYLYTVTTMLSITILTVMFIIVIIVCDNGAWCVSGLS